MLAKVSYICVLYEWFLISHLQEFCKNNLNFDVFKTIHCLMNTRVWFQNRTKQQQKMTKQMLFGFLLRLVEGDRWLPEWQCHYLDPHLKHENLKIPPLFELSNISELSKIYLNKILRLSKYAHLTMFQNDRFTIWLSYVLFSFQSSKLFSEEIPV